MAHLRLELPLLAASAQATSHPHSGQPAQLRCLSKPPGGAGSARCAMHRITGCSWMPSVGRAETAVNGELRHQAGFRAPAASTTTVATNSLSPRLRSGERVRERGISAASLQSVQTPLPNPLPARPSRGEGASARWRRRRYAPVQIEGTSRGQGQVLPRLVISPLADPVPQATRRPE